MTDLVYVLDPHTEEEHVESSLAPPLATLRGAHVVLIGNGKTNADVILKEVGRRLERAGAASVTYLEKETAGRPADDAILAVVRERATAVVAGVGD